MMLLICLGYVKIVRVNSNLRLGLRRGPRRLRGPTYQVRQVRVLVIALGPITKTKTPLRRPDFNALEVNIDF